MQFIELSGTTRISRFFGITRISCFVTDFAMEASADIRDAILPEDEPKPFADEEKEGIFLQS